MSKKTLAAGTSPFAHLLSGFRGKRAEDEKPVDEDARKALRAEEDERREQEDARRAEEDERRQEEDARRAEEDGDPDDDTDPDAQRAEDEDQDPEADSGDDDDCDGMDEKEAKAFRRGLALGRTRENARASRIFASPAAAGRPDLAATLALTTRNTSAEASRILAASGPAMVGGQRRSIDERMAGVSLPNPGPGNARKSGPQSEVDEFLALAASAREKVGIA